MEKVNANDNLKLLQGDILNNWNPERFELVRFPHVIAELKGKEDLMQSMPSVLDMPIKIPNSEVRLPENLNRSSIREMVNTCLEFEKEINRNWQEYYLYLTVHHSFVEAAKTQRRAGAHIDGMQGIRYPEKFPVCHSYLVSNAVPTRFFNHTFPTDLCEKSQNWFYEFDKVKDYQDSSLSKPFEINLMTAYSVHESTPATEDTIRTFIRLEFSRKKFDRTGNSINPLFDLNWDYQDRSIPAHLAIENFN